ncbi:hypothetical protein LEMLEM_LOCUS2018, partial [Lemmus lemmus]
HFPGSQTHLAPVTKSHQVLHILPGNLISLLLASYWVFSFLLYQSQQCIFTQCTNIPPQFWRLRILRA